MYDLCIIGAGMVGSAAARHSTLTSGLKTCLIGPTEPKKRCAGENREIYGSYYDEGRITRCCDPDPVWASLAKESIKRYRNLEHQSGINFYYEVGNLMIGGENSDYLKNVEDVSSKGGIATEKLNNSVLHHRYPYLNVREDTNAILELKNAGYINPRSLVEAQKTVAAKQGCTIIDDVVCRVSRIVQSDGSYVMMVETECGRSIQSKRVLLATGAFTNFKDLLAGIKPNQMITPLIVSLVEVGKASRESIRDMPCVIYNGHAHESWEVPSSCMSKEIVFYLMPPIKYPDGRYYIKLGMHGNAHEPLTSSADVKKWFDTGDPNIEQNVAKFTVSVFKETPTARPYIDMVHAQLGVAIGGNGFAAKSSDEIGRLAVSMVLGKWDSEIPSDFFKLRTLLHSDVPSFTSRKAKL